MSNKATDQEFADFLISHIDNPCTEPQTGLNIRAFYIKEAEGAVATFNDPAAKRRLGEAIRRYSVQ